jgi:phosphate:Na+ symporter
MIVIIISLSNQSLINLSAAVAVMIGSEIGTRSVTLIASIGHLSYALRVGEFHLLFNFVSVF